MINKVYEVIFEVTETLQNGNERTKKVSVYQQPFVDGKHNSPDHQIAAGVKALEELHYYNIKYCSTKVTKLIFA